MDRVIFGDNQFFGINHMSEDKAQAQAERFKDVSSIIEVLDTAYDCGIRGFMFNTHDQVRQICDHFRADPQRYKDIHLYPSMPYAHKYANAVNEKGIVSALNDFVFADSSTGQIVSTIARGGMSIVSRNLLEVMKLLVDAEMKMFRGLEVRAVFLQNIVADLLLGLGVKSVVKEYSDYVQKRFSVDAAFNSMNMPAMVDFLLDAGIENPIVCSSINKIGYLMSPTREACEATIRDKPFRPMAMSILASGAVAPQAAVDYVAGLGTVRSVVFGASSRGHIQQTREMIERAFDARASEAAGRVDVG